MEDIIRIPTRSLPWFKLIALTTGVGAGVGTAIATTLGILNSNTSVQEKLMQEKEQLTKELTQVKKDKDYFDGLSQTLEDIFDDIEKENEKLKAQNAKFSDIKQKYNNCKDRLEWGSKGAYCLVKKE